MNWNEFLLRPVITYPNWKICELTLSGRPGTRKLCDERVFPHRIKFPSEQVDHDVGQVGGSGEDRVMNYNTQHQYYCGVNPHERFYP